MLRRAPLAGPHGEMHPFPSDVLPKGTVHPEDRNLN